MIAEFRFALRSLAKVPSFTAVTILTLAIGIGACAAVFSIVNAVLLRPLAYPASERLVATRVTMPALAKKYPSVPVNARFYTEWKGCPAFAQLALMDRGNATLTGVGDPVQLSAVFSSTNLFTTLRVNPMLGRDFSGFKDTEDQTSGVIISHRLWCDRFSSDPSVIGSTVRLNQRPATIIGVLPADFRLPEARTYTGGETISHGNEPDVYLPKVLKADELSEIIGMFNYDVIGRLAPGATMADAVSQMNVIAARLVKLSGEDMEIRGFVTPLREAMIGPARRGLLLLLGAIFSVLLIACLNLSILALARAERRSHESAVRSALGASRGMLMRQAFIESLLLSLAGGALGCLFARWGLDALLGFAPADIPRLDEVRIDTFVLLFALGITIATALIAGLVPAWFTASCNSGSVLGTGASRTTTASAGTRRLRHTLIAVEAGVSTVLLAVAALLVGSFTRLINVDTGFHASNVLSTDISIPAAKYGTPAERNGYYQRLLASVAATPGVTSAALTTLLPLQGETWVDAFNVPGDTRTTTQQMDTQANVRFISANYFATMGIPISAGRTFRDDDQGRKPVVISALLASKLWPGQDPVGRKIQRGKNEEYEVIGIAGDVRANADQNPVLMVYQPYWAWSWLTRVVLISRTQGSAITSAPALRQAIRSVDSEVPINAFQTMDDILRSSVAQRRFLMLLAASFALSALALAGLGIYGVVSYSVTQRTREIGIRIAFGAQPSAVSRMVLSQGIRPIALGLLVGVAAALIGGQLLAGMLYDTNARDPLTLAAVVGTLVLVAIFASWLPARRATRIDPLDALRGD